MSRSADAHEFYEMAETPIREAEEIRRDCVRKLRSVETSGMFTAILAALLGEDWATPKIEELRISPNRCLLARTEGQISFKTFLGSRGRFDPQPAWSCGGC